MDNVMDNMGISRNLIDEILNSEENWTNKRDTKTRVCAKLIQVRIYSQSNTRARCREKVGVALVGVDPTPCCHPGVSIFLRVLPPLITKVYTASNAYVYTPIPN